MNGYAYQRKKNGLKQSDVAEALGVKRVTVTQWEIGNAEPTASKLRELRQLYGCTADDLLAKDISEDQDEDGAPEDPGEQEGGQHEPDHRADGLRGAGRI